VCLVWKVLRGKTYLFKKHDARGNGWVIGPRSPETEATLHAARRRKAELRERLRSLRARLAEHARLAKALRIARVPKTTAAVLRVLKPPRLRHASSIGSGICNPLRKARRVRDPQGKTRKSGCRLNRK